MVLIGDGRFYIREAIQIIIGMAFANGFSDILAGIKKFTGRTKPDVIT